MLTKSESAELLSRVLTVKCSFKLLKALVKSKIRAIILMSEFKKAAVNAGGREREVEKKFTQVCAERLCRRR